MLPLNAEGLRLWLGYSPSDGEFYWKRPVGRMAYGDTAGTVDTDGYVRIRIDGKRYKAHRLAWLDYYGVWPCGQLDHINGDRADNRIVNLRESDHRLNAQNQRRPHGRTSSGYLGVSLDKRRGLYRARINGKFIGSFHSPVTAHKAYLKAKRQQHAGCTI